MCCTGGKTPGMAHYKYKLGSHRFCLAKFQNFSKTFSKTHSHSRTDLTEQTKTPIACLQGRTYTVQRMPNDSGFQEVRNFSKPKLQIPYWN